MERFEAPVDAELLFVFVTVLIYQDG